MDKTGQCYCGNIRGKCFNDFYFAFCTCLHKIGQCLMGCGHIGEGAGLVKLELHLDGEKWFSQGGRKGEMVVGPTCAICILLCMNFIC